MNTIKGYFIRQASRPWSSLAYDFVMVGILLTCIYFGWIH